MASGETFIAQVENGLNTTIAFARARRQFPTQVMLNLADRQTLEKGTGLDWQETITENITAGNYGETDTIDNPQELGVSILTARPQLVAIEWFIGARVPERLSDKTFSTFGDVGQNAMARKMATDGHALFASAGTTLGGASTTASHAHILAGARRIAYDTTEPWDGPIAAVLHGIAIHDLQSEVLSGVGTYPVPSGMTEEVFRKGFRGRVGDVEMFEDNLIAIDSTPSVRGGIFACRKGGAVVLVQGMSPWKETKAAPEKGYGGAYVWLKNEYVWVERSAGNWMFGHLADGAAPTG